MVASIAMHVQSIFLAPSNTRAHLLYKGEISLKGEAQNHLLPLLCWGMLTSEKHPALLCTENETKEQHNHNNPVAGCTRTPRAHHSPGDSRGHKSRRDRTQPWWPRSSLICSEQEHQLMQEGHSHEKPKEEP